VARFHDICISNFKWTENKSAEMNIVLRSLMTGVQILHDQIRKHYIVQMKGYTNKKKEKKNTLQQLSLCL
ncbi:hypothetical protein V9022_10300, partial [Streptococcus agalactiae]|uniref:hypothetical protein n=1 Tax=Streptococcus agalactiae TaxID=1311 RepID=UPI00300FD6E6